MTSFLRRALVVVASLVLMSILVVLICAALMLQASPLVSHRGTKSTEDLVIGTEFLSRTKRMLASTGQKQVYEASLDEINSMLAIGNTRFSNVKGKAIQEGDTLTFLVSLKLPGFDALYLNGTSALKSGEMLKWEDTRIGALPVPAWLANHVFHALGKSFVQTNFSNLVNDGIQSISITENKVRAQVLLPVDIAGTMQGALGVLSGMSSEEQNALAQKANFYLDKIEQAQLQANTDVDEFSYYLNELSGAVFDRISQQRADFIDELEAAVFALAYALEPSIMQPFLPRVKNPVRLPNVKLAGRSDFSKHFILSSVLEILSNKDMAFAIGEIKEIRDSRGGSGYSLADIAADRAGIYFVQALLSRERVAQRFVDPRYKLRDEDYFPSVLGLKEGLSEAEFKAEYASTQSQAYLALIAEIDRRIIALPLYR